MKNKTNHLGQILTTKSMINETLMFVGSEFSETLYRCIKNKNKDLKDKYFICYTLRWISKLVYRSNKGISKLSKEKYKLELFEYYSPDFDIDKTDSKEIIKLKKEESFVYNKLMSFYLHMLCVDDEIYFEKEFEKVLDYVISNWDKSIEPIYKSKNELFPSNIPYFNS